MPSPQGDGLLARAQTPPQAPEQAQSAPSAGPEFQDQPASPEEQAEYEAYAGMAIGLLYKNLDAAAKMLKAAGPKGAAQALATQVVTTVERLEEKVGQVPEDALLQIGEDLIELMAMDMERAGIATIDEATATEAAERAVATWMGRHQDRVDPSIAQDLAQMQPQGGEMAQPQPQPPQGGPR